MIDTHLSETLVEMGQRRSAQPAPEPARVMRPS